MTEGVLNLQDELNRKTAETLQYLFQAVEAGRMSEAQVAAGFRAVFMAVNGLVDNDFFEIFTEAGKYSANGQETLKRHFINTEISYANYLSFSWVPGTSEVIAKSDVIGCAVGELNKTHKFDTPKEAKNYFYSVDPEFNKQIEL
jgi:hypothetical protein